MVIAKSGKLVYFEVVTIIYSAKVYRYRVLSIRADVLAIQVELAWLTPYPLRSKV